MLHWNPESGEVSADTVEEMVAFVAASGNLPRVPRLAVRRRSVKHPRLKQKQTVRKAKAKTKLSKGRLAMSKKWTAARKLAKQREISVREAWAALAKENGAKKKQKAA